MQRSISTRSISNVTVSFGLIQFEAKIYAAAREEGSGLNLVARDETGKAVKPVQQYAINGKVVAYNDLERGIETGEGNFVVISKDEIEQCKVSSSKQAEVTKVIPLSKIDPIFFDKSYTLAPLVDKKDKSANPKSVQHYALLLAVLTKIKKAGQLKIEMRGKEHNAIIRVGGENGDQLMLHTLFNSNELRTVNVQRPTFDVTVNSDLMEQGITLVNSIAGSFDGDALTSASDDKLNALIARKVAEAKGDVVPQDTTVASTSDDANSLLQSLTASLAKVNGAKVTA